MRTFHLLLLVAVASLACTEDSDHGAVDVRDAGAWVPGDDQSPACLSGSGTLATVPPFPILAGDENGLFALTGRWDVDYATLYRIDRDDGELHLLTSVPGQPRGLDLQGGAVIFAVAGGYDVRTVYRVARAGGVVFPSRQDKSAIRIRVV